MRGPCLLESFLNFFVGFFDTVLGARLGVAALDAIGGAAYIGWFLSLIGMSLGVAATAMVARSIGKGRRAMADMAAGQAVLLSAVMGVLVALGLGLASPAFALMALPARQPRLRRT